MNSYGPDLIKILEERETFRNDARMFLHACSHETIEPKSYASHLVVQSLCLLDDTDSTARVRVYVHLDKCLVIYNTTLCISDAPGYIKVLSLSHYLGAEDWAPFSSSLSVVNFSSKRFSFCLLDEGREFNYFFQHESEEFTCIKECGFSGRSTVLINFELDASMIGSRIQPSLVEKIIPKLIKEMDFEFVDY